MVDWNKIKIRIDNGHVYLSGIEFEPRIAIIQHYAGEHRTMAAYFTILDINVQTIKEGKVVLVESLINFILNLGIKTINEIPIEEINFHIKWIGDFGSLVGYINRYRIFTINQIAPINYFYNAHGYIETTHVSSLDGYEKEIARSIDKFLENILSQYLDKKGGNA